MRVKNWARYQHYTHRRPPWIRLYRDLLDDPDFVALPGDAAKALIMIWLIASEHHEKHGDIPPADVLAFRLRIKPDKMRSILKRLSPWLASCSHVASTVLAYSLSETDAETDPETDPEEERSSAEPMACDFDLFWESYPRKVAKLVAAKAWSATAPNRPPVARIIEAIKAQTKINVADGTWREKRHIPHPASWLRAERWDDDIKSGPVGPRPPSHKPFEFEADVERTPEQEAALAAARDAEFAALRARGIIGTREEAQ